MAEAMEVEDMVMETLRVLGVCGSHSRLWKVWRGSIAPERPGLEDLVRRKVAEAIRDMVRSHAENGNGALSRLLRNEAQEDSRSSRSGNAHGARSRCGR